MQLLFCKLYFLFVWQMSVRKKIHYPRKQYRAWWWDYRYSKAYFVTINCSNRLPFFGSIAGETFFPSDIGKLTEKEWIKTPQTRPDMHLTLGPYVVMPDHFHAIVHIGNNQYNQSDQKELSPAAPHCNAALQDADVAPQNDGVAPQNDGVTPQNADVAPQGDGVTPQGDGVTPQGDGVTPQGDGVAPQGDDVTPQGDDVAPQGDDVTPQGDNVAPHCNAALQNDISFPKAPIRSFGPQSKSLSAIIRGFKGTVTLNARRIDPAFAWQPRFYDRIIRNEKEYDAFAWYIENNVKNYDRHP
ncbi:MAG: hypothetical protein KA821_08630 [Chitinophagaceae bacterium]|nr:hypothetical protein [Chitinophagaceae bacterium]